VLAAQSSLTVEKTVGASEILLELKDLFPKDKACELDKLVVALWTPLKCVLDRVAERVVAAAVPAS
jgi:hypothetical protein